MDRPRRRIGRRRLFLLAAVAAFAMPASVYVVGKPSQEDALEQAIVKLQFFPVRPPSMLRGPGSLYHVDLNGDILDTVCTADQVLVSSLVHESPTTLIVASALQSAGYAIDGNVVDRINARLKTNQLESIHYEMRDVKVIEIAQADLMGINNRLVQNTDCDQTISRLVHARELVCQGASVLLASADYRVDLKQSSEAASATASDSQSKEGPAAAGGPEPKASPAAIGDIQQAMSETFKEAQIDDSVKVRPKLGAQSQASESGSSYQLTSGKNLYYGIKIAPLCVTPQDSSQEWRVPRNGLERMIYRLWQLSPV